MHNNVVSLGGDITGIRTVVLYGIALVVPMLGHVIID